MAARQDYNEDTSSEEALPAIPARRSCGVSNQRGRQNEQTPEQHAGEEPDTQDDSSQDEEDLESEMDVEDEGIEYMRDISEDQPDGELGFQSGEDSAESEDHDVEMDRDSAKDMDLQDMLDDLSDGLSDFEAGEDTEEHQANGESDSQDYTSNDEMSVDDEAEGDSEDTLNPLSDGPSDDEQGGETGQQNHQLADPATQEPTETKTKRCNACWSGDLPVTMLQELPCEHAYCRPCLIHIFQTSLSLASYFPARCCYEEIPLEAIEAHMSPRNVQRYREKLIEHRTIDRTYCSNRQCLEFIQPKDTDEDGEPCYGDEAECPACKEATCTKCKAKGHTGACEKQVEMDQTLDLAESEGWMRCSRCGHLIEKTDGCIHIRMPPNQLPNLVNLLTCNSQFVFAAMSSATSVVQKLILAIVNRMSIRPLNNTNNLPQRHPMPTVLGSHRCCAITIGRWWDPEAVDCVARENTPTLSSVQLAPCISAMAAETLSRISTGGLRIIIATKWCYLEHPASNENETITLRSDAPIYMIDVKSVFDSDCAIDSRRVFLNKIPQGTTLTQFANAVYGVYTTHIVNGTIGGWAW